jgi:hypothetical protein
MLPGLRGSSTDRLPMAASKCFPIQPMNPRNLVIHASGAFSRVCTCFTRFTHGIARVSMIAVQVSLSYNPVTLE